MKKTILVAVLIVLMINLIGCSDSINTVNEVNENIEVVTESTETVTAYTGSIPDGAILDMDLTVPDVTGEINLDDGSYTITEAGKYYVTGSNSNAQIIIDCDDEESVQLKLTDISLNCDYSAPIYVLDADKVIITSEGNDNKLSVNVDISDNTDSVDGVIYSKSDLIFNGTGTLTIDSDFIHGIVGKDDITFMSSTIGINVENDGIKANDSISVVDSTISVISKKDGMQVDNDENTEKGYIYLENSEITLQTGEDAINASNYVYISSGDYTIDSALDGISADTYVHIIDGSFDITTGNGYQQVLNIITVGEGSGNTVSETDQLTDSMKGIKGDDIIVESGTLIISSYEDALNANNNIVINGGVFTINAGDEGITAHNSLEINDGTINIENGYEGLEGDYITINGGDIIINVLDDGINGGESYSVVTITGGNLNVTCQGDGLDSNGDMVISGGNIVLDVNAIYTGGDGNVDVTGTLTYTGGTIVDASGETIDPTQSFEGSRPGGVKPR